MSHHVLPGPPRSVVAPPLKMVLSLSLPFVTPLLNPPHNHLEALDCKLALPYTTAKCLPIIITKTLILVLPMPSPFRLPSYQVAINSHTGHSAAVAIIHPQDLSLQSHMSPLQKKCAVPAMAAIQHPSLSVVSTLISDHRLALMGSVRGTGNRHSLCNRTLFRCRTQILRFMEGKGIQQVPGERVEHHDETVLSKISIRIIKWQEHKMHMI